MPAISYVGAAPLPGTTTTSMTFDLTGLDVNYGDAMVIAFTSRDHTSGTAQPTVTDDGGGGAWTQLGFSTDRKAQLWGKMVELDDDMGLVTITVSGCVGSCSGVLKAFRDVDWTGGDISSIVTNIDILACASGTESKTGFTPSNANSVPCSVIHNYTNDNAVTSHLFATATGESALEDLSTGGSDCGTNFMHADPLASGGTGDITWAQTNAATYCTTFALKPHPGTGIQFRAKSTMASASGTSISAFSKPTGTVVGDTLIAVLVTEVTGGVSASISSTSDTWTLVHDIINTTPTPDLQIVVWICEEAGSSSSTIDVTWGGASVPRQFSVYSFFDGTAGDPLTQDVAATENSGTSTTITATGLASGTANRMLVGMAAENGNQLKFGVGVPLIEREDAPDYIEMACGIDVAGTDTANKSIGGISSAAWVAVLMALKVTAGGGGGDPEGRLTHGGKLVGGGLLKKGVLVG